MRRPALATTIAADLWDAETHAEISAWLVESGRDGGSPHVLRLGLAQVACAAVATDEFGKAMSAIAEEEAIADALGVPTVLYPQVHLAAMRGRREELLELNEKATTLASTMDLGMMLGNVH